MPKRTDLKRILVIGSGPIVIGQACEFDYSGTQACKALRDEGLEVVLVNSNPGDDHDRPGDGRPDLRRAADRRGARAGHRARAARRAAADRRRPDGAEPAVELAEAGVLDAYGVKLIGASIAAIKVAEDRLKFKEAMRSIGIEVPDSAVRAIARAGARGGGRRSAFRSSSGRRSRSAASAAASPTTSRSSGRSASAG